MLVAGKKFAVFAIRKSTGGSIWVRAGSAWVNKDGSMNVLLDVLPIEGRLHVREAGDKREATVAPHMPPTSELNGADAVVEFGGQP